jgi:hypothetical protein
LKNTRTGIKGGTPDICHILMFYWFEPVLYLDPVSKFPETTERPGYFVVFAGNVGKPMTFKILKMTWSQFYIEEWLDEQQMPVIGIEEYHLSQMYKNH